MHIFEGDQPIDFLSPIEGGSEERRIENFFTAELVDNIAKARRVCSIDDMLGMGLQCAPCCLEKVSASSIPLTGKNGPAGFILLYRSSQKPLVSDEINCVAQITPGLARSIAACRALVNSVETV
jgi:hypothetical protein